MLTHLVVLDSLQPLWTVALQTPLSVESFSQTTGVGCHALLQGIFLTQRLNPRLLGVGKFFTTNTTWEAAIS